MTKSFQYSVLRYRPSYLLAESVNVGLLFYFPSDKKLSFAYPSSLSRISNFFPDLANISDIRYYLNAFDKRANQLSREGAIFELSFDDEILKQFIVKDANSFYFSESKYGHYNNIQEILEYYKKQYFKFYSPKKAKEQSDAIVRNEFEEVLKRTVSISNPKLKYFKRKISIDNKINPTEFDFGWQNGKTNLIKAIGFNLVQEESIQRKAFRWFGELTKIREFINPDNVRFDFLVSKPKSGNLINAYNEAIEVLKSIDINKEIIEENNIESYVGHAFETIKPFSYESIKLQ